MRLKHHVYEFRNHLTLQTLDFKLRGSNILNRNNFLVFMCSE